jgi:hypothetical protein
MMYIGRLLMPPRIDRNPTHSSRAAQQKKEREQNHNKSLISPSSPPSLHPSPGQLEGIRKTTYTDNLESLSSLSMQVFFEIQCWQPKSILSTANRPTTSIYNDPKWMNTWSISLNIHRRIFHRYIICWCENIFGSIQRVQVEANICIGYEAWYINPFSEHVSNQSLSR